MIHAAIDRYNRNAGGKSGGVIEHRLVHTGQHYEHNLSEIFFAELPLPKPDHYLDVGSGTHGAQTAAILERTEKALIQEEPDTVIVYGDTNSTLAGALAAAKLHIPLAHVEAGLRSFNRRMPEEINRVMADHLSDVLFCPTQTAIKNLRDEGISQGVVLVGDVMLDSIQAFEHLAEEHTGLLRTLGVAPREYILATIHRAENTDSAEKLTTLMQAFAQAKWPVILPMHPRLREILNQRAEFAGLKKMLTEAKQVHIIESTAYIDMLMLEANARLIMTDSGGVQKEAYFVGVPCLTLRDETEWLETLQGGWNQLVEISLPKILQAVEAAWSGKSKRRGRPRLKSFGGGNAADRMVTTLVKFLGRKNAAG
jgi:UDP-N-acetylglucosamine 2-epimerase (non-hydrolysing)/UDP-GlcNAc3NAcA epimerase